MIKDLSEGLPVVEESQVVEDDEPTYDCEGFEFSDKELENGSNEIVS